MLGHEKSGNPDLYYTVKMSIYPVEGLSSEPWNFKNSFIDETIAVSYSRI
jgi:hypothetical protein